jgi:hypothetical protein
MNSAIPGVMSGLRPSAAEWSRYPGAQPFGDDDLSRRIFFGRERESTDLTNRILASPLTVVYGRSGLGKSSLLNAGVAQRLRVQRHAPLVLRLNDTKREFGELVAECVRECAELQGYEVNEGNRRSLWHFFKTIEIWDGDLLLTPVLIFDQFEEVFTLQSPQWRAGFLPELGALIRGEPPPPEPGTESDPVHSENPPQLRVVLSLREDFLGLLEDASDHIPRILDNRFRLTPLSTDACREALTAPAAIQDPSFPCPPFRFSEEAIDMILGFLTRISAPLHPGGGSPLLVSNGRSAVDPFQLQLLCQKMERLVVERLAHEGFTGSGEGVLRIGPADFGGERGLSSVIDRFYGTTVQDCVRRLGRKGAVGTIGKWKLRRRIECLCSEVMISPEGTRLSIEQNEIRRHLGLRQEVLDHLVERRLLRMDQRAGALYYELSHDTLVRAVLREHTGWFKGLFSSTTFIGGIILIGAGVIFVYFFLWFLYSETRGLTLLFSVDGISTFIMIMLFVYPCVLMIKLGWNRIRKQITRSRRSRLMRTSSVQSAVKSNN